jgi:hypothetical protein
MKRWYIYLLMLLLPVKSGAQDIFVKSEYPKVVTTGESFMVTWTINSGGGEISVPPFTGFNLLGGPQTSYSSNQQWVNGKFSQETSYSFVYYIQAKSEGKFVIAPATIRVKNKMYKSDSLYIEVVKDPAAVQPQQIAGQNNQAAADSRATGSDLFIRLIVNRSEVFLGEPIVASVKLFTKIDLGGLNEVKYPAFNGFLKENLETPQATLQRENVNGTIYGAAVVQQFLLFPQITGEIQIDPVEITALVRQNTGQSDPFFGDFFTTVQNVPRAISSLPVKIRVKPYPGVKPADFSGVVGKIDIKATLSKDSVNVNDALNFRISVNGSGNLKLAGTPSLKLSPDVEVYDPKVTEDIRLGVNGSSGQKTFEYVLIPRHYGDFTIPPVTYSYFNPGTKQYEKLTTPEYRFYARKVADQGGSTTVYGGVSKEDVKYLGKDIRFQKASPGKLKKFDIALISQRSFLSLYGFALALFLLILFIRREHIRRNADLSLVRNRKAAKIAGKRLQEASKCLKSGTIDRFHEEILKALWGYLSDKLSIPVSELTRNNSIESLRAKGVDDEQIEGLSSLLDKCEFARFAPATSGSEASEIFEGASRFIRSVENKIG